MATSRRKEMGIAMATRPLRIVKPYGYAAFAYLSIHLNASSTPKPSFLRSFPFPSSPFSSRHRRLFCTATLPSANDTANKVSQFRKKLKVADVKGDQLDVIGHTLVITGWVRTLRLQSSVTFLEVNSIHRLNLSITLRFLRISLVCIAFHFNLSRPYSVKYIFCVSSLYSVRINLICSLQFHNIHIIIWWIYLNFRLYIFKFKFSKKMWLKAKL